jgi:hypothetical protein
MNIFGSKINEINRDLLIDKNKLDKDNKNLINFSPNLLYRKIKQQTEINYRSKSRNSSKKIINNKTHSNLSKNKS